MSVDAWYVTWTSGIVNVRFGLTAADIHECLHYQASDPLAAEFSRTFQHANFPGKAFLDRYEALDNHKEVTMAAALPKMGHAWGMRDIVTLYGWRSSHADVYFLSPWEFVQWWKLRLGNCLHQITPYILLVDSMRAQLAKIFDEVNLQSAILVICKINHDELHDFLQNLW